MARESTGKRDRTLTSAREAARARPATKRRAPGFAGGQPVRRNDRLCGDIPAVGEVVVNERLDKKRVHVVFAPSRERPLVVR